MNRCLAFLLLLVMIACTREREEPVAWSLEVLPSIFSVITPGSTVKVYISSTYGDSELSYPQAKAYITDDAGNKVELVRRDSVFIDSCQYVQVAKGKTYRLTIELGDGSPLLTASTTVPNEAAVFSEYFFQPIDSTNEFQNTAYFRCKWSAVPTDLSSDNYWIKTSWGWSIDATKNADDTYQVLTSQLIYPKEEDDYHISLLTADIALGRYLLNERYQDVVLTEGMDFFNVIISEFSGTLPDFSNIENGVGLFGSYLSHTRDLEGNVVQ